MWEKSVPKWWIFIVFVAGKREAGIYYVKWFNRLFDADLRLELRYEPAAVSLFIMVLA